MAAKWLRTIFLTPGENSFSSFKHLASRDLLACWFCKQSTFLKNCFLKFFFKQLRLKKPFKQFFKTLIKLQLDFIPVCRVQYSTDV